MNDRGKRRVSSVVRGGVAACLIAVCGAASPVLAEAEARASAGAAAEQRSRVPVDAARRGAADAATEVLASIETLLREDGSQPMNGESGDHGTDDDGDGHGEEHDHDHDHDGAEDGEEEMSAEERERKEHDELLDEMRREQQRLQTEYSLMQQRQKNEMLEMELERSRMQAEMQFRSTEQQEELSRLRAEIERLNTESQHARAVMDAELAEMRRTVDLINAEKQLKQAQRSRELDEYRAETERLQAMSGLASAEMGAIRAEISEIQTRAQREVAEIEAAMNMLGTVDRSKERVLAAVEYPLDPVQGDTLYISDRRIALNGPIITGTADWVTKRINYFNNRSSEQPIFLVIDNCPGGSVMQGYRIVNAIENSDAPVYVVVKSFAASMAAVITTLADQSYALPNAIILHHQMSSGMSGNLTQQAEQLENSMEWSRRLHEPVTKKMGITYDRFVALMYENDSGGDWEEFADKAVELKWVDEVVTEIREQGILERPEDSAPSFWFFFMSEPRDAQPELANMKRDEQGRAFIQLPPLQPFDHYFMHDPYNFYRY